MPTLDVKIPSMGESITCGVLAKWHVQDGDIVKKDQPLFELETDKITSEGTAEAAGRIALKVAAGRRGEDRPARRRPSIPEIGYRIPERRRPEASATPAGPPKPSASPDRFQHSPAVRRLAAETGVDPAKVAGTGKGGRVTKGDMLAAAVPIPESGHRIPESKSSLLRAPPPATPEPIRSPVSEIPNRQAARQTRRKLTPSAPAPRPAPRPGPARGRDAHHLQ